MACDRRQTVRCRTVNLFRANGLMAGSLGPWATATSGTSRHSLKGAGRDTTPGSHPEPHEVETSGVYLPVPDGTTPTESNARARREHRQLTLTRGGEKDVSIMIALLHTLPCRRKGHLLHPFTGSPGARLRCPRSIGTCSPSTEWFFTGHHQENFKQYLCLMNPPPGAMHGHILHEDGSSATMRSGCGVTNDDDIAADAGMDRDTAR